MENTDPRIVSAGARKERLRQRAWNPPAFRQGPRPYAELRAASAFSFLDGSSLPEDLVEEAARQGLPSVALVDSNGVYGAPRFYKASREAGIKALVGAEATLEEGRPERSEGPAEDAEKQGVPRFARNDSLKRARNDSGKRARNDSVKRARND
ncbi:MAG TPA: PHP domain-containing protein, partial [Thermoanaerobaculia bacterium]|nr:PHP domain-containing protein [Thermoanaerobaculia bacterium]